MPLLDFDVARTIIEMAAEEDRATALTLVFVSRLIQQWADRILFQEIVLGQTPRVQNFLFALESATDRAKSFPLHVKTICFQYEWHIDYEIARRVVNKCSSLVNLSCWYYPDCPPSNPWQWPIPSHGLAEVLFAAPARPYRNSVILEDTYWLHQGFGIPVFRNITHITIRRVHDVFHRSWESLSMLSFSHLSIELTLEKNRSENSVSFTPLLGMVNTILPHCPGSLRVFLIYLRFSTLDSMAVEDIFDAPSVRRMILGQRDSRVVLGTTQPLHSGSTYKGLVVEKSREDLSSEWAGRKGIYNKDSWELAEQVQASRSKGDVA